ncbi:MAG: FAD-dependent oxidoreductase, partial [Raoultibacter sp.]
MKNIAIIGGGPAGLVAAIAAARAGAQVTVYEAADRVGKTLLATGNGRCNFSNA